ncbi:MAG: efflux RND transporter permease subunit, partial [Gemmatimonadetes bacterium]|nr:efflux RND transporter permease subunit [Gemmatimonadota bacterium]
ENARLNAWVYVDIRDVDVGSYVERARKIVGEEVDLPAGYSLIWSGQYEYMERARQRLTLVVPLTLAVIFLLLYLHFRSVAECLMVMLTLPFALVGGIWLIYLLGYNMSIAVGVGFIALAGVSAELGVVMLTYLDQELDSRRREGRLETAGDLAAAVVEGASRRVRPIFMTVGSTVGGLLPIMWASGTGSQVMKRIVAPMVGGLATATLLALLVLPAVYTLWRGLELRRRAKPETDTHTHKEGVEA